MAGSAKEPWRHHIVPRHYLKGFTEAAGSKFLWSYEKGGNRVGKYSYRSVGYVKDFHTIRNADGTIDRTSVEKSLATKIEQPTAPIIDKIRAGEDISPQEKWTMSRYMCTQVLRVPKQRDVRRKMAPKQISDLAEEVVRVWPEHLRGPALKILDSYATDLPDMVLLDVEPTERMTTALYNMTWVFLMAPGHRGFITSDDPVSFDEGIGIAHKCAEVTLPISTRLALWATWQTEFPDCRIHTTDRYLPIIR